MAARFGRQINLITLAKEIAPQYHVSAFTNPNYPIITSDPEVQIFKWGLIPFWTKTEKDAERIRRKTYNAKAETIFKLPSFREPIKSKRCLVPSTGYFEWRHEGKNKIPYFVYVRDEEIFSMAGIYDVWHDKQAGEVLHTFSIVTGPANDLTGYIHNNPKNPHRMPVILASKGEEQWLQPDLSQEELAGLLKPFGAKDMDVYTIKPDFVKKASGDPTILDKAA